MKILGWLYFIHCLESATFQIYMSSPDFSLGIQFIDPATYLTSPLGCITGPSNLTCPKQSSRIHVQPLPPTCADFSLLVLVNGSLFTVSYKDLSSLSSGFFSSNTTPCMCRCHLALFMSPCGIGAQATGTKMLILWILPLLWLINWPSSLTQKSRVFYQHPWTCGSLTGQVR